MFLCRFLWCGRTRRLRRRDEDDVDIDTFLDVLTDLDRQEEEDAEGALAVAENAEMNDLRRDGELAREDKSIERKFSDEN
tara:strand:- start:327 stop:566 length:240 start_codon:yes stop_codon:yes gene_type:complete